MLVWNPPPLPPQSQLLGAMFKGDVQVAAWKQRRGYAAQAHEDPGTMGLSENSLAYILTEIESRRHSGTHLADHLHNAMVKFTPRLSQPTVGGVVEAMAHIWAQPEMLDMWSAWESTRSRSARGPAPSDPGAKAVMATLGMTGNTHGLDAYCEVLEKPELLRVFARVEAAAAARAGDPAPGPFKLQTYRGSMKRFEALSVKASSRDLALATNAAMFRSLCELYPDRPFGRGLLIDGCLFPAWTPQIGKGSTDEMEARRRRMTPHAGARMIEYKGTGKYNLEPNAVRTAGHFASSSNFDRGYYYVCILDQASGWPLVSLIMDAAFDEAEALTALLSDLYRHFSFIKPRHISGDGAWDEAWAHRLCEMFYDGLAPVFRHTERSAATTDEVNQSKSIKGFTHDGRLLCMDHGNEMPFHDFERPPRGDLRPGQAAHGHPDSAEYQREMKQRERAFRIRALHKHGPGTAQRVGMSAAVDWRRLNAFPRHPNGRPDLYAERQALGMRLKNQMEGHFSRMQGSLSLLTEGADRVRLQNWDKLEQLLHLAELRMNALSLAAERGHEGVGHVLPTEGDVAPLPEFPFGSPGSRLAKSRGGTPAAAAAARAASAARRAPPEPAPRRHMVPSALVPAAAPTVSTTEPDPPELVVPPEQEHVGEPAATPTATLATAAPVVATTRDRPTVPGATVITVDFANRKRLS